MKAENAVVEDEEVVSEPEDFEHRAANGLNSRRVHEYHDQQHNVTCMKFRGGLKVNREKK